MLFALSLVSCDGGQESSPSYEPLQSALESAVARNGGYGGGLLRVASASEGLLFEGAAGEVAPGLGSMTPATTFEIASVSKTFTAVIILSLAEEGRLSLDDPLAQHYPTSVVERLPSSMRGAITVRQLLNHTSGLPDYWTDPPYVSPGVNPFLRAFIADPDRFWPPEDILPYIYRLAPLAAPGRGYHYSDTNYLLLGLLAQHLSGKPLHQLYRERIFTPLGMDVTYLSYREAAPSSRPESHRFEGGDDLHGQARQSADWGGGGLVSSAADLVRFSEGLFVRGQLLSASSLQEMRQWVATGEPDIQYGLGLFRVFPLDDGGGELIGHDGHGNAFMFFHSGPEVTLAGTLNQTENDWWPLAEAYLAVGGR